MLGRNSGFTAVAVLTLALGIGANSALFSVVNAVLLSPLPFREPERLVMVFSTHLESQIPLSTTSGPDFLDWRRQACGFEDLAAIEFNRKFNLSGVGESAALNGALVTPSFFSVFGVQMLLGRPFTAEDAAVGHENGLILTHGAWRRQFGGDTNVVGRAVTLNGQTHVVLGVLSPRLRFVEEFMEAIAPLPNVRLKEERAERRGCARAGRPNGARMRAPSHDWVMAPSPPRAELIAPGEAPFPTAAQPPRRSRNASRLDDLTPEPGRVPSYGIGPSQNRDAKSST